MSMLVRADNLTDKHFKRRNIQRLHKALTNGIIAISVVTIFCIAEFCAICWLHVSRGGLDSTDVGWSLVIIFFQLLPYTSVCVYVLNECAVKAIVFLKLYTPLDSYCFSTKYLLIDPDGNPEMCKIGKYPALEGFYGYRLPNAGDLHKIAVYLDNRGLKQ